MSYSLKQFLLISESKRDETIRSWANNIPLLQKIIDSGHADIHYAADSPGPQKSFEQMYDDLYTRETATDTIMPAKVVQAQIQRVTDEMRYCSYFYDKDAAIASVHEVLSSSAASITDWLASDDYKMRIRANMGAFIGSGIALNGAERSTTACTICLCKDQTYINGEFYPFTIKTAYPDIRDDCRVGVRQDTGRVYGKEILARAESIGGVTKLAWACTMDGVDFTLSGNGSERALYFNRTSSQSRTDYALRYNERAIETGAPLRLAEDPRLGKKVLMRALKDVPEVVKEINAEMDKFVDYVNSVSSNPLVQNEFFKAEGDIEVEDNSYGSPYEYEYS